MRIIEITVVLVLVFLVVTNARGFNTAASAISGVYTGAVKALQGPERLAMQSATGYGR